MVANSNINPNYPVPGVQQSSQGFRDNFAAARNEILNLQSKTIVVTGDVSGISSIFDSEDSPVEVVLTLTDTGVAAGTYINPVVTVDVGGRITAISQQSNSALFNIQLSVWQPDVATIARPKIVNGIEVLVMDSGQDTGVYVDVIIPENYNNTLPLRVRSLWRVPRTSNKLAQVSIDWSKNGGAMTHPAPQSLMPVANNNIEITQDISGSWQSGDVLTIRISRLADANGLNTITSDAYADTLWFVGARLEQQ